MDGRRDFLYFVFYVSQLATNKTQTIEKQNDTLCVCLFIIKEILEVSNMANDFK